MSGYQPWVNLGISEAEYLRKRLVEARKESHALAQALEFIRDCEDDGEEMGPIVNVGFLKEQARAALARTPLMTQFILESNPLLFPGQQWDHRASFMAHDQNEADAMAFRWARHHGFDARSVRTTPTDTGWTCDDFMEQFR